MTVAMTADLIICWLAIVVICWLWIAGYFDGLPDVLRRWRNWRRGGTWSERCLHKVNVLCHGLAVSEGDDGYNCSRALFLRLMFRLPGSGGFEERLTRFLRFREKLLVRCARESLREKNNGRA